MTSPALELLQELRVRGVTARVRGGDLSLRPREALDAGLVERVRAHKGELVQLLRAEAATGRGAPPEEGPHGGRGGAVDRPSPARPADAPLALLPAGADPDRPPSGWLYVRSGPLAECWVGPSGELDSGLGQPGAVQPPAPDEPRSRCRCCRGSAWWRLGPGRPWVCPTCHPPLPGTGPVERWPATAASPPEASDV